jgi:hypothetical protein
MRVSEGPGDLCDRIDAYLTAHPAPVTYAALAAAMGLTEVGRIATLTGALERLMERNAATDRPFLAAWVISRATGLPALGFFQKAKALGRYSGPEDGDADFVAAERAGLSH